MTDCTPPISRESSSAAIEFPFDLYATSEVVTADDVEPGDVVANLAPSRRYVRNPRDLIRVSRIEDGDVLGYRVFPQEWEREVEYVIVGAQIEGRRLRRVELPK